MELVWSAIFLTLLPWIGSLPGSLITSKSLKSWYNKDIKKPNLVPPNWVFPVVWTFLYLSMGYASYLVWRDGGKSMDGPARLPLILFTIQLLLNYGYSLIFFGLKDLKLAFYECVLLDFGVLSCVYTFKQVNERAFYLLLPYLVWVSFACYLSYSTWKLNPSDMKTKKKET